MDNKGQVSLDIGDQLVYQLVRVEEDGTVVPASEDEVIEVESFLEGGAILHSSSANVIKLHKDVHEDISEQDDSLALNESLSDSQCLDGDGGLRKRLVAQLTFLDTLLDRLNEKKHISGSSGVEVIRGYISRKRRHGNKFPPNHSVFMDLPILQEAVIEQCEQSLKDIETNSDTKKYDLNTIEKKNNKIDMDTRENFSLDKLSIRELHEAFRTTLGQQTSVKKRKWLEQRKTVGLGCSVEVDSTCIPNGTKNSCMPEMPEAVFKSYPAKINDNSQTSGDSERTENNAQMKSLNNSETKRKRKPTKRYIEELALPDMKGIADSNGPNVKKSSLKNRHKKKDVIDSVKASDIKFRSKSRYFGCSRKTGKVRLTSKTSGRAAQLVRKAISVQSACMSRKLSANEQRVKKKLLPNDMDLKSRQIEPTPMCCSGTTANVKDLNSSESAPNAVPQASLKKQHHPWTIGEVTKLLEGVTRFGVGKWTDIKKILFSNINHRTSTDLKDKWRNLVRASNRHYKVKSQEGQHHRKHSLVPKTILVQVHELAAQRRRIRGNSESSSGKDMPDQG